MLKGLSKASFRNKKNNSRISVRNFVVKILSIQLIKSSRTNRDLFNQIHSNEKKFSSKNGFLLTIFAISVCLTIPRPL